MKKVEEEEDGVGSNHRIRRDVDRDRTRKDDLPGRKTKGGKRVWELRPFRRVVRLVDSLLLRDGIELEPSIQIRLILSSSLQRSNEVNRELGESPGEAENERFSNSQVAIPLQAV
jgi:hypothetical protein